MARSYIMPLGFIDRINDDGATILLTNPDDSLALRVGTPITVWRYSPEHLALGKLRGRISEIGFTTATFVTDEIQKDPRWPVDEELLLTAAPLFLALEGTFEPDPIRKITPERAEALRRIARRYAQLTAFPDWESPDVGATES